MVLLRNAVHSALSLVATMMSLGAFYLIEQGPFLGLVQIIVYTGAIMILFLFVLMLVGRDSSDSLVETLRGQRWAAALFGIGFALLVALTLGRAFTDTTPADLQTANSGGSNVNSLAALLFTQATCSPSSSRPRCSSSRRSARWCSRTSSATGRSRRRRPLARERIRSGRPQPLPGPGVLSTGNAIGTPALLPDGSISTESVMSVHPGGARAPRTKRRSRPRRARE